MSAIRYFNGVPHIVRYGMRSDKEEKSSMTFWRCGVKFSIDVSRSDIMGTRFEKQWSELALEPIDINGSRKDWVHQWEMLCDCIIRQCLEILEKVAPDNYGSWWINLRDYLHCPGHHVKMVKDEESGDAKGELVGEPLVNGAYELVPLPAEEVGIQADDGLTTFKSEDLKVIDREINWRTPPYRVQLENGRSFALSNVERYSRWADTGKIENNSVDKIKAYLWMRRHGMNHPLGYPDRIPKVLGYITDKTVPGEKREKDGNREELIGPMPEPGAKPLSLVAGILLTDFTHFRSLGDLVREAKGDTSILQTIKEHMKTWKKQTMDIVKDLHARGIAFGKTLPEMSWFLINQHVVHVEDDHNIWLDPPTKHVLDEALPSEGDGKLAYYSSAGNDYEAAKTWDLEGVETIYEKWLPEELAKIEVL